MSERLKKWDWQEAEKRAKAIRDCRVFTIKFDGERTCGNWWTAFCSAGRLGDFPTLPACTMAIEDVLPEGSRVQLPADFVHDGCCLFWELTVPDVTDELPVGP